MLDQITITGVVTLKELRMLFGMNQEEFAELVGIPYRSYRRYEQNMRSMSVSNLFQISEKTGVALVNFKRP
ncbi:helix-turn-helix domain-containing protein [Parasporobacterium paucivorans]|uniref:Helix-turn-helix n=1 Tax=Parasporobacterium paucivorans DSM 15970 TaxID=1122934 RepID=A0A1M6B7J2_9FIRM|nr:helix-turn-helix transcriptional regulator [Parasporobacterium paucivorans]SHI44617.1 Helix-turn-helix [Parasporobacterium paucivorans DSM 15970]